MFSSTSQSWEHLSVSIYCLWHLTFSCIRVGVVPVCIHMRHSEDKLLFLFFGQNRSSSRATATSLTPDTSRWFESPLRLRPANQSGRRESASMREVENLLTSGHFTKHIENRITGARQLQFDSAKIVALEVFGFYRIESIGLLQVWCKFCDPSPPTVLPTGLATRVHLLIIIHMFSLLTCPVIVHMIDYTRGGTIVRLKTDVCALFPSFISPNRIH